MQYVRISYLLHLNLLLNSAKMTPVKAKVLETVIESFHSPVVAGLSFRAKLNRLIIYYHSDGNGDIDYEIVFENPRGFKLLDEGDMCNYWENEL